jgi:hypothetical protein
VRKNIRTIHFITHTYSIDDNLITKDLDNKLPKDWEQKVKRYKTISEAINDGWKVVSMSVHQQQITSDRCYYWTLHNPQIII